MSQQVTGVEQRVSARVAEINREVDGKVSSIEQNINARVADVGNQVSRVTNEMATAMSGVNSKV